MLINNDSQKAQFRTEFLVFLMRNQLTLTKFVNKFNKEINFITKLNRENNYGMINQRLNSCKKIDTEFFQKLIDLVDKEQRIQFLGQKVVISKRF